MRLSSNSEDCPLDWCLACILVGGIACVNRHTLVLLHFGGFQPLGDSGRPGGPQRPSIQLPYAPGIEHEDACALNSFCLHD